MVQQFNYIIERASRYSTFNEDGEALFSALSELDEETLQDIYQEYGDPDRRFQPVNLLRAESARRLLEGSNIDLSVVDEIKDKIREKDLEYFPGLNEEQLDGFRDYKISKRDIFANWQNLWSIYHTFFYRGTVKETVNQYLDQISQHLLSELELPDYQAHFVDFQGANNFGSVSCWVVLYPMHMNSHRGSYQFFLRFSSSPDAGRMAGDWLEEPVEDDIKKVAGYDEVYTVLRELKDEIISLNQQTRNFFKLSPGVQAADWEWFKTNGVGGISQKDLDIGDISEVETLEELNQLAGLESDSQSSQTRNAWIFKIANSGDVVYTNNGSNTVLGIGIIEGPYFYQEGGRYRHCRKVNWITDKVYDYTPKTHRKRANLFRTDSFSPTDVGRFILNEYVRLYPDLASVFDKYQLPYDRSGIESPEQDPETDSEDSSEVRHWWLNANPKIWAISDFKKGERQTYTTRNERGNKRRIYKYFEAVSKGDLIIGYESSPVKQIRAILEVTKGLHQSEKEGEVIEFELIEKLEVPVSWNELKNDPGLEECEVFINKQGSLFTLSEEEYEIIHSIIDEKNITQEIKLQNSEKLLYDYESDPDKPFIPADEFEKILSLLKRKKNIILQGPPGVGKTFIAQKLAYQFMGYRNNAQIEFVQFHQSYSYEDFVQGLRLTKNGTDLRNGIFYSFCQQAHAHPDRDFFIIIDEINRGNLSKIFGELLMLIESDKRKSHYAAKLTYAEDEEDTFFVPPNLYLIGTMNTADRSLAIIDYALRRRFAFVTLDPVYDELFRLFLREQGVSQSLVNHICSSVEKVNSEIKSDPNLGSGFQIGHSYFCGFRNNQSEEEWYSETLDYEIQPLLEEIWFDNSDKVRQMMKHLEN